MWLTSNSSLRERLKCYQAIHTAYHITPPICSLSECFTVRKDDIDAIPIKETEVNVQFGCQSIQTLPQFIVRERKISHYLSGTEGTVIKVYIWGSLKAVVEMFYKETEKLKQISPHGFERKTTDGSGESTSKQRLFSLLSRVLSVNLMENVSLLTPKGISWQ